MKTCCCKCFRLSKQQIYNYRKEAKHSLFWKTELEYILGNEKFEKDKHVNGAKKGNIVESIASSSGNCFTLPALMSVKTTLSVKKVVKIRKTKLDLHFHSSN